MTRDLGALTAREHDLVVIGGGIHGAAVAWDAAQRGLSVALIEAGDFGAGTSWNSLKTVHGGLRHLQRGDLFGLRESARERSVLLRIAPGLVRLLPFVIPTYRGQGPSRAAMGLALRANDLLTADRNSHLPPAQRIAPGRLLSASEVLDRVPGLEPRGLTGGAEWTDAQVTSTERLLMAFLAAAAEAGAAIANYVEVVALHRTTRGIGGVVASDVESGLRLEIRGRMVISAVGPALDIILAMAGFTRPRLPLVRATNVMVDRAVVTTHAVGARHGGRFLFLVPWHGRSIVGTAYEPVQAPVDGAAAFLREAGEAYPWAGLQAADVVLVHRGMVPASAGEVLTRSRLIDHERQDGLPGLISIVAAKYTTARAIAERALALVVARMSRRTGPCRTAVTPLPRALSSEGTLEERTRAAVREEAALHLDDAVLRRLDLGTAGRPAEADVDVVAATMATEHGWDASRQRAERERLERAVRLAGVP